MVQILDLGRFLEHVGKRTLELRDAALFMALVSYTDTYSGRIRVTAGRLAQDIQITESEARAGIARLKKQGYLRLVKDKDTGERYYRANPWMVQSGGDAMVGLAKKEFADA